MYYVPDITHKTGTATTILYYTVEHFVAQLVIKICRGVRCARLGGVEHRTLAQIAFNLRRLRDSWGISLSELARRAELSRGTLSRLESGRGNPTIDTLGTLARAFGVEVEEIVNDPESETCVVRAVEDAEEGWARGQAVSMRALDRMMGRAVADIYEARFEPEIRRSSQGHMPGAREYLFVVEGRLLVGPEGEESELGTGDYTRFAADRPHVYRAIGGPARALLIMSYLKTPSSEQEMQREVEHLISDSDRTGG